MPLTPSLLFKSGALLSATGITAGAFGAHALAPRLGGTKAGTWAMASQYALINGVALLALSQHPLHSSGRRWSGPLILAGTGLFSGSIFALLLFKDRMGPLVKIVGPTTPIGGLLMIGGYLSLLF